MAARRPGSSCPAAGFQSDAVIWVLSAAGSARSPSGNSNRSRPGTCWAAAGAARMIEPIAAKMKRDIYLSLLNRYALVKRTATVSHEGWLDLLHANGSYAEAESASHPARSASSARRPSAGRDALTAASDPRAPGAMWSGSRCTMSRALRPSLIR
jgi:hypothetical protein